MSFELLCDEIFVLQLSATAQAEFPAELAAELGITRVLFLLSVDAPPPYMDEAAGGALTKTTVRWRRETSQSVLADAAQIVAFLGASTPTCIAYDTPAFLHVALVLHFVLGASAMPFAHALSRLTASLATPPELDCFFAQLAVLQPGALNTVVEEGVSFELLLDDDDDARRRADAQRRAEQEWRDHELALELQADAPRAPPPDAVVGGTFTCAICADDDVPLSQIFSLNACAAHICCLECARHWVAAQIADGRAAISCPAGCDARFVYDEVRRLCNDEQLARYDKLQLRTALAEEPNARYCPKCSTPVVGGGYAGLPLLTCVRCGTAFCFNCDGDEWHPDATCAQYQQWRRENSAADERFTTWAAAHAKRCPKCAVNIEKNNGCNSMRCTQCGANFCWLCLEVIHGGHFSRDANDGKCKQFS